MLAIDRYCCNKKKRRERSAAWRMRRIHLRIESVANITNNKCKHDFGLGLRRLQRRAERRKRTFQGSYAKIICKLLVCWKKRTQQRRSVCSCTKGSQKSARIVWLFSALPICIRYDCLGSRCDRMLHITYITCLHRERAFAASILPFYMHWSLCVCVAKGRGENATTRWRDSSETPLIKVKIQRKNWGAILSWFGPPRNWDGWEKMGKWYAKSTKKRERMTESKKISVSL